jgi:putative intracellular protease/amidase
MSASKKQKSVCPDCHGTFSLNASGEIHGHKCTMVSDTTDWKKKYIDARTQLDVATAEVATLKEQLHHCEKKLLKEQIELLKKLNPVTPTKQ